MFTHDFSITNIYSTVRVNCKTVPSAADYSGKLNFNELILSLTAIRKYCLTVVNSMTKKEVFAFFPKPAEKLNTR